MLRLKLLNPALTLPHPPSSSRSGYFLKGLKLMNVSRQLAESHYADLSSKPFFKDLVDYIISGPVVAMVWEGKDVVKQGEAP